jgi:DNA primase
MPKNLDDQSELPRGVAMSEGERRQKLIERIPLIEIVSEYMPLHRDDVAPRFLCPFHNDNLGTFELDRARRAFQCRACRAECDIVDFVRMYEGITVAEALEMLETRSGV